VGRLKHHLNEPVKAKQVYLTYIGLVLCLVFAGFTISENRALIEKVDDQADTLKAQSKRFDKQALKVRSQNCSKFEEEHLQDVTQLRDTYDYLSQLTPAQKAESINAYVLSRLPETEARAKKDKAPKYCDEPGFGRPEPDPKIPERPEGL
jgi:DNA-binding transcriptional MerR regulator